ncbi:unnamed protein product, partial [Adineta steineri]
PTTGPGGSGTPTTGPGGPGTPTTGPGGPGTPTTGPGGPGTPTTGPGGPGTPTTGPGGPGTLTTASGGPGTPTTGPGGPGTTIASCIPEFDASCMSQYNVITLGDLYTTSDIELTTICCGNLLSGATFANQLSSPWDATVPVLEVNGLLMGSGT